MCKLQVCEPVLARVIGTCARFNVKLLHCFLQLVVLTNRFLLEMFNCHTNTLCSYTAILNSQIKEFSLKERKRLETALKARSREVARKAYKLQQTAKQGQMEQFLLTQTSTQVMKSEVLECSKVDFKALVMESHQTAGNYSDLGWSGGLYENQSDVSWSEPKYLQMGGESPIESELFTNEEGSLDDDLNEFFSEANQEMVEFLTEQEPLISAMNIKPSMKSHVNRLRQTPRRLRFQDKVKFSSSFKQAPRGFDSTDQGIAVILNVTNRFMLDVHDCHQDTGRDIIICH